ncbi:MAG: LysR family transcriptional regulator [Myxococcota bacterium]
MEVSLDRLRELVTVVDAGSISAAARRLKLPRSTLSRRLTSLEQSFGVRLVHRKSRSLRLTQAGVILVGRARHLLDEAEETWRAVRQFGDRPSGRLGLSTPPDAIFNQLLVNFAEAHPDVELLVFASGRSVDVFAERVDLAIRYGAITDERLIARRLWSIPTQLVASPSYLQRHGRPHQLADLAHHQGILRTGPDLYPEPFWPLVEGGTIAIQGRVAFNDVHAMLYAAVQGLGIALLPVPLAERYLRSRQLEPVLPLEVGRPIPCSFVYPDHRFVLPQVRAFIDYAISYYADDSSGQVGPWWVAPPLAPADDSNGLATGSPPRKIRSPTVQGMDG